MRNLGGILVLVGVGGFIYCSSQLGSVAPLPEGLEIADALGYTAGRLEVGRYVAAFVGVLGFILLMFPKGR